MIETTKEPARDLSFAICGVCGGEHDCGFGYAPDDKSKILWACRECLPIAEHCYGAPKMNISRHRLEAIQYAGARAGEYLESIGKFDLSTLTPEEWLQFLVTFEKERALELRRLMAVYCPPF